MRTDLMSSRVGVIDNGGNTYYGSVQDVIVAGVDDIFVRCDFDEIEKKEKVDGKTSAVQRSVADPSVGSLSFSYYFRVCD